MCRVWLAPLAVVIEVDEALRDDLILGVLLLGLLEQLLRLFKEALLSVEERGFADGATIVASHLEVGFEGGAELVETSL